MLSIIRVVDLESTGLDPATSGVVEIGFCDVLSTKNDLAGEPTWWEVGGGWAEFVNPGYPIPPEASAVHQIVDVDVRNAWSWPVAVDEVCGNPNVLAFAAHQAKFERQWITDDLTGGKPWICTYRCALRLWSEAPAHSNQALKHWRKPEGLDRTVGDIAHRAWPDAYVTAHLLRDMINDGARVEQLIEWSNQPALQVTCQIGDWRGRPWSEVDDGFLHWILRKDFDEDVVFTVRSELERRERERRPQMDLL